VRHARPPVYAGLVSLGLLGAAMVLLVSRAAAQRTSRRASVRCVVSTADGTDRVGAVLPSGACMLASGDVYGRNGTRLRRAARSAPSHGAHAVAHGRCLALDAFGHVLRKRDGSVRMGAPVNGGLCMLPDGYAFTRAKREGAQ